MDRKRIENIIIIILVLLNVFLISVTAADGGRLRKNRRETEEAVSALLESNGIIVGENAKLLQDAPALYTVVRDFDAEQERMEQLIGSASSEDLGGSIRFYRSENGQAVLRGTGELDMLLEGSSVRIKGSRERTAEKLFSDAGVETGLWMESQTDSSHMDCCCFWNGVPVFNAKLGFDFNEDCLSMVSGTMVLTKETERKTEGVMDASAALVRFLEIVSSEGFICSCLQEISPGYLMSVTVSGESTLTPIWHIKTDTGDLYINAVSGKTETVA